MAKPNNPISNLLASVIGFVKNNKLISAGMAVVALAVISGVAFGAFSSTSPTIAPTPAPTTTPPSQTKPDTIEPTATPATDPVVTYVRKKTTTPTPTPTPTSTPTPTPTSTPVCPSITVADIATSDTGTTWLLNANATILACQTLVVPAGELLLANGHTLTNNGVITVAIDGILIVNDSLSVLTNNGSITNYSNGGGVGYPGFYVAGGRLNNYGTFNNMLASNFTVNSAGTVYNYPAGTITNNSFIQFYMTNTTLYNSGSLINQDGAEFLYQIEARIYNYGGGVLTNNGTFNIGNGTGNIYNADGAGVCGTGLINGTNSVGVVVAGATCP